MSLVAFFYCQVSLGSKTSQCSSAVMKDNKKTLNPNFFEMFEFTTQLPGPSLLKIQMWNKNTFLSDKFMGETIIDLEERWFHPKWTKLDQAKPVEVGMSFIWCVGDEELTLFVVVMQTRRVHFIKTTLELRRYCIDRSVSFTSFEFFLKPSSVSQGILMMWVDIMTAAEAQQFPPVPIGGPEKRKFEVNRFGKFEMN